MYKLMYTSSYRKYLKQACKRLPVKHIVLRSDNEKNTELQHFDLVLEQVFKHFAFADQEGLPPFYQHLCGFEA